MNGANDRLSSHRESDLPNSTTTSARRLIKEGRPAAAVSILRKITNTRSDDLQAKFMLAAALYRSGNHPAALSECDAIFSRRPRNPYAHHIRGLCLAALGARQQAIDAFSASTHLDPLAWRSWNSIAEIT